MFELIIGLFLGIIIITLGYLGLWVKSVRIEQTMRDMQKERKERKNEYSLTCGD